MTQPPDPVVQDHLDLAKGWRPRGAAEERWTLTAMLRDATGAVSCLVARIVLDDGSPTASVVFSAYGEPGRVGVRRTGALVTRSGALAFTGDELALDWSTNGERMDLSVAGASLSCALELSGLGLRMPTSDGFALPDLTVCGTVTVAGDAALALEGQAWIERRWSDRAAAAPGTWAALWFTGGERLRLEDGPRRRSGTLQTPAGTTGTVDAFDLAPTGYLQAPGTDAWVPWGWRLTLPADVGSTGTGSFALDPWSREDVQADPDGSRFVGLTRLRADDRTVGFAIVEAPAGRPPVPSRAQVGLAGAVPRRDALAAREPAFSLVDVGVAYGDTAAVRHITLDIPERAVTALIGPSGSGKSTLIRVLNRMNDLVASAAVSGLVRFHGHDLYASDVDPVQVRRKIGMVFQRPNPFPKSIFDNVAYGPRVLGMDDDMEARVEEALRRAALWDEVSGRLSSNAFSLSGGQQQRLVIARALATRPDVLLMDEPASALDPYSTSRIEDLMLALREDLTIVVVTHNMQQAARVADMTAFLTVEDEAGALVEYAPTEEIFTRPRDPRTDAYVTGRFG